MEFQVEDLNTVQKKISVVVESERVTASLDEAYRNLSREVRMKGFRPGKVPRKLLEKRYSRHVEGEVSGQLISEAFEEAIKEHELSPVSQPIIEKTTLRPGEEYSFSVTIEIQPKVELETWEGIDVEWERAEVPEEQIDQQIEAMLDQNAIVEAAEEGHAADNGDLVLLNARLEADGQEPYSLESLMVAVGQPMGIPVADWLGSLVSGMKVGDSRTDEGVEVPPGTVGEAWEKVQPTLHLEVNEIKTHKRPELDDEFAADVGFDSLQALREDTQSRMEGHLKDHTKRRASRFAVEKLIELNPFEVPQGLVRGQGEALLQENLRMMARQGLPAPQARLADLNEEHQNEILDQAAFAVRRALILEAIADSANIEVSDEQVDNHIETMAEQLGQQPAAIRSLLQRQGGMDDLRGRLREDQAEELMLEKANVTEVDPRPPEEPKSIAVDPESVGHDHDHSEDHDHDHSNCNHDH